MGLEPPTEVRSIYGVRQFIKKWYLQVWNHNPVFYHHCACVGFPAVFAAPVGVGEYRSHSIDPRQSMACFFDALAELLLRESIYAKRGVGNGESCSKPRGHDAVKNRSLKRCSRYSLDKVGPRVRYVMSCDASFSTCFFARNVDEVHAGIRDRESIVRGGGEAAEDSVGVHVRQGLEYLQILF